MFVEKLVYLRDAAAAVQMSFSSAPGGAAPGAPKQGDISESRLERTFPGLLRFTGVGADSGVPSSLCKETFAAEPGGAQRTIHCA